MLVVGIDVAAEVHQVAVIDETESVVVKPTPFAEDAAGYQKLFELLARAGALGGGGPARGAGERAARAHVGSDGGQRISLAELVLRRWWRKGTQWPWSTRCAPIALSAKSWRGPRPLQIARFGAQKRRAATCLPEAAAAAAPAHAENW
jgi:hypothetical protein